MRLLQGMHPEAKARWRVVERTHSWINRWRKLPVSFEKSEASHTALLSLAAAADLLAASDSYLIYLRISSYFLV